MRVRMDSQNRRAKEVSEMQILQLEQGGSMRQNLIDAILEAMNAEKSNQVKENLKRMSDSNLISLGIQLGLDTDSIFKEMAFSPSLPESL